MPKRKPGRPVQVWPKEKIKLLKQLFPIMSNAELADQFGVTVSALRAIAAQYNVKKKNRYWSKQSAKMVLDLWESHNPDEIVVMLQQKFGIVKTKWAVINKYRELSGLK